MVEGGLDYRTFSDYTKRSKSKRSFFILLIVFLLIAVGVLGGLFVVGSLNRKPKTILPTTVIVATTTPLPTSSVSAVLIPNLTGTVTPSSGLSAKESGTDLDKSKLRIVVLNGSGEKGAARQISTYLESMGYQISRVDNADAFTYKNITVIVKKSKSSYAALLRRDLQSNPSFAPLSGTGANVSVSLSDEISGDAEVIVGK